MSEILVGVLNSFSKFIQRGWYIALLFFSFFVFILSITGYVKTIPAQPTAVISLGVLIFSLGEWRNHPLRTIIIDGYPPIKGEGYNKRIPSTDGRILNFFGCVLILIGIAILLF